MALRVDALDERSEDPEVDCSRHDQESAQPVKQIGHLAPGGAGGPPEERGHSKADEDQGHGEGDHPHVLAHCARDYQANPNGSEDGELRGAGDFWDPVADGKDSDNQASDRAQPEQKQNCFQNGFGDQTDHFSIVMERNRQ